MIGTNLNPARLPIPPHPQGVFSLENRDQIDGLYDKYFREETLARLLPRPAGRKMCHGGRMATKTKPKKPYSTFPMYAHSCGQWAAKVCGKTRYFGAWNDWETALETYEHNVKYLAAGREPPPIVDGISTDQIAVEFLRSRAVRLRSGEIGPSTYGDYHRSTKVIVDTLGVNRSVESLGPIDFTEARDQWSQRYGLHRLKKLINITRMLFKFADSQGLIEKRIVMGDEFRRPSAAAMRRQKRARGPQLYDAETIRKILETAAPDFRVWVLLGLNAAYGAKDLCELPSRVVDLDAGRIEWPRPKTAIDRCCVLWPETVEALKAARRARAEPAEREFASRFFLSGGGRPLLVGRADLVAQRFRRALEAIDSFKPRCGFYTLRHTTETVGGASRDQVAVNAVMGHGDGSMAEVYRESIEDGDERVKAVCWKVREWLWPEAS